MNRKLVSIVIGMVVFATMVSVAGTINTEKQGFCTLGASDNWSMLGHDPQHTSYTASKAPETNRTLFQKDIVTPSLTMGNGIAIYNGRAYVNVYLSRHFYSLQAYKGDILFDLTFPGTLPGVPATDGQNVYLGCNDGKIYAVNALTGVINWNYTKKGLYPQSSPTIVDGKIYIGCAGIPSFQMVCLDTNGNEHWNYTTGGSMVSSPAVADGKVYFGSGDKKVYCLNAADGTHIWNYTTGGTVSNAPVVADGKVYIGSGDGKLYCFNAADGKVNWTYSGTSITTPAVHGDKIYIGATGMLRCLNTATGSEVWNYPITVTGIPALADGKIYVGSYRKLYCLRANDGRDIWNYTTPSANERFINALAVYDGIVYALGDRYNLYAFSDPNHPPEIPVKPSGPTEGKITVEYTFTTQTTDPDNNSVWYKWKFGAEITDWFGPYNSGAQAQAKFTWNEPGVYEVKVKARDNGFEEETGWSPVLSVTIREPKPTLVIDSMKGGLGISAVIKNTGDADATNVKWSIELDGGLILVGQETTGTIPSLAKGTEAPIKSSLILGIGKTQITLSATCDEEVDSTATAEGFVFLFFVLGV